MARTLEFDPDLIPQELRDLSHWMCASGKRPLHIDSLRAGSKTNPEDWASFDDYLALVEREPSYLPYFCPPEGYYWVDIDRVKEPLGPLPFDPETGDLHQTAAEIVEALGSYAYRSRSGSSIHVVVRSERSLRIHRGKQYGGLKVEILGHGDGVVMTSDLLSGSPRELAERTDELSELYAKLTGAGSGAAADDTDWALLEKGVAEGSRHDTLCALVGHWSGLSAPAVMTRGLAFAKRCKPPYPMEKAATTIAGFAAKDAAKSGGKRGPSQTTQLTDIAKKDCRLFRDQAGSPFAEIKVAGHIECYEILSEEFRHWLAHRLYEKASVVPSEQAVKQARSVLVFDALTAPVQPVFVRCGVEGDTVYYDLCDAERRVVEIQADRWEIVKECPIHFRRYGHMLPQVEPISGGSLEPLLKLLNLSTAKDRMMVAVYIVSLFLPEIDHLIGCFLGAHGSAKSDGAAIVGRVIDPSGTPLLRPPKNERDITLMLQHHYVAFFDNITKLPDWLADELCCAVTGIGQAKRSLYTNDAEFLYQYRRCVGFTAISSPLSLRPDALDRSLFIQMKPITNKNRKTEVKIKKLLKAALPEAVGACFDAVARALDIYPSVKPEELPRMADFYVWGSAIALGLGYEPGLWEAAYLGHVELLETASIENDVVALMVIELAESEAGRGRDSWEGEMMKLHKELEMHADALDIDKYSREWPRTAAWLSNRLGKAVAGLLGRGIKVSRGYDSASRRSRVRLSWPEDFGNGNGNEPEPVKPKKGVKVNMDKTERDRRRAQGQS